MKLKIYIQICILNLVTNLMNINYDKKVSLVQNEHVPRNDSMLIIAVYNLAGYLRRIVPNKL